MLRRGATGFLAGILTCGLLVCGQVFSSIGDPASPDVLLAPRGASAQPRRSGKVVRVKRPRLGGRKRVLLCPMPLVDKKHGTCYGHAPQVGDVGELFGYETEYRGRIRVTSVGPSESDQCDTGTTFDFTYEIIDETAPRSRLRRLFSIAVFGVEVVPERAKLVTDASQLPKPAGDSRAQPWMGIDKDGNDRADVIVTAFECSDLAPRRPPVTAGRTQQTFCLDYWQHDDKGYGNLRRDFVHTCL